MASIPPIMMISWRSSGAWRSGRILQQFKNTRPVRGTRPTIRFVLLEDMPPGGSVLGAVTKRETTNEIQRITLVGDVDGGTFRLSFDGETTAAIDAFANAAQLQAALEGLSNINSGDVTVEDFPAGWRVIFTGQYAATDVPLLSASNNLISLEPANAHTIRISSEYDWVDAGRTETIHEVIPVGSPTPLIAGAVGVASWFPELPGYGLHALECRDLDFDNSY